MTKILPKYGLGTLVNHALEGNNPENAHITPIFQTSTFYLPDVETGADIFNGEQAGYVYTRAGNPNATQLAKKIAILEGWDMIRDNPEKPVEETLAELSYLSFLEGALNCDA